MIIEHLVELQHFYPIFTSWAGIEPKSRPLLLDIGIAVETVASAEQKHLVSSYQHTFSQVGLFELNIVKCKAIEGAYPFIVFNTFSAVPLVLSVHWSHIPCIQVAYTRHPTC